MKTIARVIEWTRRAEMVVACAILVAITSSIFLQVVTRYVFGMPLRWVEEAGTAGLLWITVLSASLAYKEAMHIRIWTDPGEGGAWRLYRIAVHLIVVLTSVVVAYYGLGVFAIENMSTSTSLPVDLPKGYISSGAVIYCFASISLVGLYNIFKELRGILTGDDSDLPSDAAHDQVIGDI